MIRYYNFIIGLLVLTSCGSTKNYLSRVDEDRTLFDVVKALQKHPDDSDAVKALPVLYATARQRHLDKINSYSTYTDLNRWDKLSGEYTILQMMYESIIESNSASAIVKPINYQSTIFDLKLAAAGDYYNQAMIYLDKPGRNEAKTSYNYFKKSDKWVGGYKDAREKMNDAFQNAIVNIVVNPVTDNSFFFNSGLGNTGYNFSNEYFQQSLLSDLGGLNINRYPARFYSDWEARRDNVKPDWVVELTLRNLDIPRPSVSTTSRSFTKQIESGRDTSGQIIYQNISATLYTTHEYLTAGIDMQVDITEISTRKNIMHRTLSEHYSWNEEHSHYTGDERAINDKQNYDIMQYGSFNEPTKHEVLYELYRKLYPQVKNNIGYAVEW